MTRKKFESELLNKEIDIMKVQEFKVLKIIVSEFPINTKVEIFKNKNTYKGIVVGYGSDSKNHHISVKIKIKRLGNVITEYNFCNKESTIYRR